MSKRSKRRSSMRIDVAGQGTAAWHNCWNRNRHAVNRMNRGVDRAKRKWQTMREINREDG